MSNTWDCEFYNRCKNNSKCLRCGPEQRLLKLPEDKGRKQFHGKAESKIITSVDDNSGKTLEEYIETRFNALPTVKEWMARRQLGSGNIWFMPGDVKDSVVLAEAKERLTVNSKGEKNMTIPKTMLEKIEQESKLYRTYPVLVFRYKGDESGKTYFVQDFDYLVEMVHEIKLLRHELKVAENERNMYKKVSEELHKEVQRLEKRVAALGG